MREDNSLGMPDARHLKISEQRTTNSNIEPQQNMNMNMNMMLRSFSCVLGLKAWQD